MEGGIRRNVIIQELTRSPHGKLHEYVKTGVQAAREDPEFLAHLIAWNEKTGQIRDSKVALPVVYLHGRPKHETETTYRENALAHLALLDPRNLVRAVTFAREIRTPGATSDIRRLVERYLRVREAKWSWWERAALQHREPMKSLYASFHVKPSAMADLVLFKRKPPKGTVFDLLKRMSSMSDGEIAGAMLDKKLPFLIMAGALGARAKKPTLLMALIERMSPVEVVTNAANLEKLGVKNEPELRAAFEQALQRAAESTKATLKTTRAADAVKDEGTRKKLQAVQEKQFQALGGVDGNWLILADKSGSMERAIDAARQVAAILSKAVKGKVNLVFFDAAPRHFDVTGCTYEEIRAKTRTITANGGTSIGCGLHYAIEKSFDVDGIAIVSDGGENQVPYFDAVYHRFVSKEERQVPVYFYLVGDRGDSARSVEQGLARHGYALDVFDLRFDFDYNSLPNLVATMRTNRYSLADTILETPLLTLDEAFGKAA